MFQVIYTLFYIIYCNIGVVLFIYIYKAEEFQTTTGINISLKNCAVGASWNVSMAEQLHASLTSPSVIPNVGWSGVKLAATGLWSSGNICCGETNYASLFGSLMGEAVTWPCLFQHHCSPVHTERFIKTWLDEFDVEELDWLTLSPDLNHIEHLWDELKWKLSARPLTSLPDLTYSLMDEWAKMTYYYNKMLF